MTAARAEAYASVMRLLRVLDPARLQPEEVSCVRHAADTLVLCAAEDDTDAQAALTEIAALASRLVHSGRWMPRHLHRFIDSICCCAHGSTMTGSWERSRSASGAAGQSSAVASCV